MQSRRKWMQKTLALITVIVLLVMMLPAAAFAAGNGNGKGNGIGQARAAQAHEAKANRVKGEDDPEDLEDPEDPEDMEEPEETEDPEEMSEWAMYVHARNEWAREMGLAPGHANLLDKLLAATADPDAEVVEPPLDPEAEPDPMAPLQTLYDTMFGEEPFSVKEVIQAIKTARIAAREAEATLEAIA